MKSHFQFSKKQRSGIFLLVFIVLLIQLFLYWSDSSTQEFELDNEKLRSLRLEVDSLNKLKYNSKESVKLFPFNPNFISDFKGSNLGMSVEEIDKLLEYRKQGLWVNSEEEFQKVTGVSDSWLDSISPFFKFPDWVVNQKPRLESSYVNKTKQKSYDEKIDLNKATVSQLQKVNGIGAKLSERIVNYRERLEGGFLDMIELTEIYGLSPEVIVRIQNDFAVKTPRQIEVLAINVATIDQLVTIPYIDYEVAFRIIEERTLREGFKSIEELTKIEDFPKKKIDLIGLYLQF